MRAGARRDETGQAVVLVLVVVVFAVVAAVAVGRFAARVRTVEQAQVAADAAALAGVIGGESAAVALARRNGGALRSFRIVGEDVLVTVVVDGVSAVARAGRAP